MSYSGKTYVSLFLAVVVMIAVAVTQPWTVQASDLDLDAESAILVDAKTGKILYAKKPDMALPPASMTKMMTEYLVHEAIEDGDISWDTTTQISDYAYSISANTTFSGVGLKQSKDYTVKELYEAMAINSDNATTIALAELVAGSEGEFVKMMNKKAKEMGLPDYKFVNSTGLHNSSLGDNVPEGTDPNANNQLSARSAALLAYHLINDYPKALDVSKVPSTNFDGQTIRNYNWMLPHDPKEASSLKQFHYKGVDGLKTGHTDMAQYCFTGTAKRDGNRFISVIMRAESEPARFQQTAKLLNYGFQQFQKQEIFPEGYQLDDKSNMPVAKGKKDTVQIAVNDSFRSYIKQGQKENYAMTYHLNKDKLNKEEKLTAPVKKGEKIGTAEIVYKGDDDYGYIFPDVNKQTMDLTAQSKVEKANWFMLAIGSVGHFFSNLFTTVTDTVKGWF
ncbi:D-alanyl-D-alanine carboxypeptidase [Lentibacillus halophilus]|uniref:serine-type D-Ala-D-Ala carboxypeptidase n=1 Tax=Lentibacillus halophilus TaxID=295065 RepID=A0ABN0Z765_9BACI